MIFKPISAILSLALFVQMAVPALATESELKPQTAFVDVYYACFELRPLKPTPRPYIPFRDRRESAQGFAAMGDAVSIGTPANTGSAKVTVQAGSDVPNLDSAKQAVAFPLRVVSSDLVITDTNSDLPRGSFKVPPGNYMVVAAFYPDKAPPDDAKVGLNRWHIVMTFLPHNKLKPQTFKVVGKQPVPKPEEIYIPTEKELNTEIDFRTGEPKRF